MARLAGLEPTTLCLEDVQNAQYSLENKRICSESQEVRRHAARCHRELVD
jgi:hypothetical protein